MFSWTLWCTSVPPYWMLLFVALRATQKPPDYVLMLLFWAARASGLKHICWNQIGIALQTTLQCGLDPICKNHISSVFVHVFVCCSDFLKSICVQFGYTKIWIWALGRRFVPPSSVYKKPSSKLYNIYKEGWGKYQEQKGWVNPKMREEA